MKIAVLQQGKPEQVTLPNVLHVPECTFNLLSAAEVTKAGCDVIFRGKSVQFINEEKSLPAHQPGTYYLDRPAVKRIVVPAIESPEHLWHRRLGHMGVTPSQRIGSMVTGLEGQRILGQPCETCEVRKTKRQVSRVPMRQTYHKMIRTGSISIYGVAHLPSHLGDLTT